MDYFTLKLGKGNRDIGSLKSKRPQVTIYFDDKGKRTYSHTHTNRTRGNRTVQRFVDLGGTSPRSAVFVVVAEATVWIVEPSGEVRFGKRTTQDGYRVIPKTMPVRVLKCVPSTHVPLVLASIACSRSHRQRTLSRIKDWGNLKAIDAVLGCMPMTYAAAQANQIHWKPREGAALNQGPAQLLECLSSTEFETLIAKLFEAHGCHVPANCGGTLGDIDLFAWNTTRRTISFGGIRIAHGTRVSIQVKRWASGMKCPPKHLVNYLVGCGVVGARALDEAWILRQVRSCPSVRTWLRRSLHWLPSWYFDQPLIRLGNA